MVRISEIQDALFGLVGWEEPLTTGTTISDDLQESESGLTFNSAHALMTYENIKSILPSDVLTETNGLNDYLERFTKNTIAKVIQNVITTKKLNNETRSLLEHRNMFDGSGRLSNTTKPSDKLVGLEINPVRSNGVTTTINKIGLQINNPMDEDNEITIYLFHSSSDKTIQKKKVTIPKNTNRFQWFDLNWQLPYKSSNIIGGSWYVMYDERDLNLGVEAINVSKDWSREPCGTCNIGSVEAWRELTKYLQVSPFITNGELEGDSGFSNDNLIYTNTSNHGINLEVSVYCDITDFIIEQRAVFADVLQKQVAYDMIRTMALNPNVRVNRNQSNVDRNNALYELDGNGSTSGFKDELEKAYKALDIDLRGIDRVCLSCSNNGVRYRGV